MYVMDWTLSDPNSVARMERMVRAMEHDPAEVIVLKPDELPGVIRQNGWIGDVRQGAYQEPRDPDILFNASHWVSDEQRRQIAETDLYKRCAGAFHSCGDALQGFAGARTLAMLGASPFYHLEDRTKWDPSVVCWSLHDIHSACGCVHRCAYCARGSVYVIHLNLEEFVEKVDGLLAANPWQKTIRYDVEQDVLPIEPEYGACKLLVEDFAKRSDRYLFLFSKSANIDHLLDLDHRGRTIMLWTLSTHTVSRRYEPKTGTLEERLEAARLCQQAGYRVRLKSKPIIPLVNWREEITDMLEKTFAAIQPENLSFECVFFRDVAEMDAVLGLKNLDPTFVAQAIEAEADARASGAWPGHLHGQPPFTFEAKQDMYRHYLSEAKRLSPSTPVSLCAESVRMWEAMDDVLGYKPWNYVCNCGPHCVPGLERIDHIEGPDVERVEEARALGRVPIG